MHTRRIVIAATATALIGLAPLAHAQSPASMKPMKHGQVVTKQQCTDGGGQVETDRTDFSDYCKGGTHDQDPVEG